MKKIIGFLIVLVMLSGISHAQSTPVQIDGRDQYTIEYSIVPRNTTAFRYEDESLDKVFLNASNKSNSDAFLQVRVYQTADDRIWHYVQNIQFFIMNTNYKSTFFKEGAPSKHAGRGIGKRLLKTFYFGIRGAIPYADINGGYISFNQEFRVLSLILGVDGNEGSSTILLSQRDDIIKIPTSKVVSKASSLRLLENGFWVKGDVWDLDLFQNNLRD